MILKNVDRTTPQTRTQITIDADLLRGKLGIDRLGAADDREREPATSSPWLP